MDDDATVVGEGSPLAAPEPDDAATSQSPLPLGDDKPLAPPPDEGALASDAGGPRNPLLLAWHALTLRRDAYDEVRDASNGLMRGFVVLVVVLVVAGLAQALGNLLGLLTTPPLGEVQAIILENMQRMSWYRELAQSDPGFRQNFIETYNTAWSFAPALFGAPSLSGAASALVLGPIGGVINWLIFGLLTYLSAKLLKGQGNSIPQFLGVFALAYTPKLFTAIGLLPGGAVAGGLVFWWLVVGSYLAVRSVHGLSWGRAAVAVLLPRLLLSLLALIAAAIGGLSLISILGAQAGG